MKSKNIVTFLLLCFCVFLPVHGYSAPKKIIGETAWITVSEVPFDYLSRIDTGARSTSVHAVNIQVKKGSEKPSENIGKKISFTSINGAGESHKISTHIVSVSTVKNSQGVEQRYVIEMTLSWKGVNKKIEVNLRDRSAMQYKMLIGRNWLSNNFLVDVDLKADEKGVE